MYPFIAAVAAVDAAAVSVAAIVVVSGVDVTFVICGIFVSFFLSLAQTIASTLVTITLDY